MRSFTRSLFDIIPFRRRSSFSSPLWVGAGMAIGAIGALLLTPRTGAEVRGELADRATRLVVAGKDQWATVRKSVKQLADHAEQAVTQVTQQASINHRNGPASV